VERAMVGLRERQKEDRQNRIKSAAKILFTKHSFDKTTIESIAEAAGVSGVTVHNYYGTKAGILLALVIESDKKLIETLDMSLAEKRGNLIEVTSSFARIIMDHAILNLEKVIWRQVIAAVTKTAGSPFSKAYFKLDQQLAYVLVRKIEAMQTAGDLPAHVNSVDLGKALFHLQNARFIQFICSDDLTANDVDQKIRSDLSALLYLHAPAGNAP
jgi:AcrR family transcriptional regulator